MNANPWLTALPTDHAAAIKAMCGINADELMAIRSACADIIAAERHHDVPREDRTPGARMAYWAASTILNVWPSAAPLHADWVYDADHYWKRA